MMNKSNLYYDIDIYSNDRKYSFSTSIEDALIKSQNEILELYETIDSIKQLKPECDKLDYILAASSGALCGVIDVFLVGKPGESPIGEVTDKWFEDRVKDFAKMCHPEGKSFDDVKKALRFLEGKFNIPYDQTGRGDASRYIFDLSPKNHHFKSLGHNPTLFGLFFSILDQFDNSSHFITDGQLISLQQSVDGWELKGNNIPAKIFSGFSNWIGHLISDISGSSSSKNRGMGIPSPILAWTNDIIVIKNKLNLKVTETDKAINELALEIFEKGFDARFQVTQAIPVFINEMLVRFIYSIRRLFTYFIETKREDRTFSLMWKKCEPFSNPTVKRMLSIAHGTFCMIDVGDATIRSFISGGGNFNPNEFILRLNIAGIGRLSISLYGEANRAISYSNRKKEVQFSIKEKIIVENYIDSLKQLSKEYDDTFLLTFINDFENSECYKKAFMKSVSLAELRKVPEHKILKNKSAIDKYFGG